MIFKCLSPDNTGSLQDQDSSLSIICIFKQFVSAVLQDFINGVLISEVMFVRFINPEIYESSEETSLFEEGCLSLPGLHENVRRPVTIRMRYLDEDFVEHDEEFTGKPARVIQHEYDHIEGRVFTDHLAPLRRNLIKNKLQKMARGSYRAAYKTKR
jgi:peptide deformylase